MSFTAGPISIGLNGDHPVVDLINTEMSTTSSDRAADVVFRIHAGTRAPTREVAKGTRLALRHSISLESDGVLLTQRMKSGPVLYQVLLPDAGKSDYDVYLSRWTGHGFPWDVFVRPASRDGEGLVPLVAKNVLYEVIDPLVWLALLSKGATFLHASGIAGPDGRGILFTGTGGVGKSTTLLELMNLGELRYLSDDLAVLSEAGIAYRYPKRLQIYAYNLQSAPAWRATALASMRPIHRIWWQMRERALGGSHSRRRLDPSRVFGSRVATEARLEHLIWLAPSDNTASLVPMERDVIANRLTAAVVDEFWGFLQLLNLASLAAGTRGDIEWIVNGAHQAISAAISNATLWEAKVTPHSPGLAADVSRLLEQ